MSLLAIQLEARNLIQLHPMFVHCKTTGAGEFSEVVEIAILDINGTPLVDELVKPKRHIRQNASDEHGITDEMINFAPRWAEVLPKVEEVLVGRQVCLYDLVEEMQALKNSNHNSHNRWVFDEGKFLNLMDLFSRYKNERNPRSGALLTYTLENAVRQLGIDIEIIAYRRAHEDAWLLRALLLAIAGEKVYY
ncbi:MAG TPA: exonuclease domain-containing protein [Anaerolineales bacterium]